MKDVIYKVYQLFGGIVQYCTFALFVYILLGGSRMDKPGCFASNCWGEQGCYCDNHVGRAVECNRRLHQGAGVIGLLSLT